MDLYNLPDKSQKVQIFTTSGMWHKPRGISMVYIHIVGGGGGGNGGGTGALGTVRAGGGGGGGANTSRLCLPAVLISDSLIIEIGLGGNGGAGGGSLGDAGGATTIYSARGTSASSTKFLVSTGAVASASAPTAGTPSSVNTVFQAPLAVLGVSNFLTSLAGGSGGSAAVGSNCNWATLAGSAISTSGGGGGGGASAANASFSGGTVVGTSVVSSTIGGAAGGFDGNGGIFSWSPLYHIGGSGGGGNGTGTGGKGGDGASGCGGGGGGAGVTGGAGGRGGDGYCVIVCW
jgi:hypothetical protein